MPWRRSIASGAAGKVLTGTDSTPSSPFTSSATCTDSNCRISSARGWLTGNPINTQPITTGARMGTMTNW